MTTSATCLVSTFACPLTPRHLATCHLYKHQLCDFGILQPSPLATCHLKTGPPSCRQKPFFSPSTCHFHDESAVTSLPHLPPRGGPSPLSSHPSHSVATCHLLEGSPVPQLPLPLPSPLSNEELGFQAAVLKSDVPRRSILMAAVFLSFPLSGGISRALPPPPEPDLVVLRSFTTPAGVRVQEVIEGNGPEAQPGSVVQFNYVCRRSNGYYVYSTVDPFNGDAQPVQFPLGQGQMIAGLEEVLEGMRPGGKRRALVPPSVGYINKNLQPQPKEFGPLRALFSHAGEPLVFEVQLLKVK